MCLDAIIIDAVGSLAEFIANLENILCNYTESMNPLRLMPEDASCSKGTRLRAKGGYMRQKSA